MSKPTTSRPSRRRIAGERTAKRPGSPSAQVPPPAEHADRAEEPPAPETTDPEQPGPEQPGPEQPGPEQPGPEQPAPTAESPRDAGRSRPARRGPGNPVLACLAVLAAAVVAAAAYFAVPAWHARAVEQAQTTAPSVAERAAKAILSYDYRSLDRDEKAAAGYLTPAYRTKYQHTFALVRQHAPALKAKVTAQVLGSGVSEADADHAHVLLFVNQTTTSAANPGQPQIALNRVMFDMVRRDGGWRVNGISSY